MTLEEFAVVDAFMARELEHHANGQIDGVYQNEDGRWVAHIVNQDGWGMILQARCKPNCFPGISDQPRTWVYEDHVCCERCVTDPAHRFQGVHE